MAETVEVIIGRIGRAHGIRGDVTVERRTDEPERRFSAGATVREDGGTRQWTVSAARLHSGRFLVRFDGVDDRTAAEALRGVVLVTDVPADEEPAGDDEFYDRQLIGLSVRTAAGEEAGRVTGVHHGAQDLLMIRTTAGAERLVPFVEQLVPEVDLAGGFLRLAAVDGLLSEVDDETEQDATVEPDRSA